MKDVKYPMPQHGPHPWMFCDRCNYDRHQCHFCGADLSHNQGIRGACPGCLQDHDYEHP